MIPSLEQVIGAHTFIARRYDLRSPRNDAALDLAQREATSLAADANDEPAALFFAFARRGKALGDAWALLTDLLTLNQIASLGLRFVEERSDLRPLRTSIAQRAVSFPDVREWFAARLK